MKLILALSAALLVAACATAPMQTAEVKSDVVCDVTKMNLVEQTNRGKASMQWIHCPQVARDKLVLPPSAPDDTPQGPAG